MAVRDRGQQLAAGARKTKKKKKGNFGTILRKARKGEKVGNGREGEIVKERSCD